ncbi:MAG: heavy metal translocating P-type ATPase [Tissierellia bacterium]|nr:heavy metal translocating P-type ATPase [Tissierellia bacterium]
MEKKYNVYGMTCSACSAAVEREVAKVPGVQEVSVNLLTNSMKVVQEEGLADGAVLDAVVRAGYDAESQSPAAKAQEVPGEEENYFEKILKEKERNLLISALLLLPLMYIAMGPMMGLPALKIFEGMENILLLALTQFLLTTVILFINRHYYISGMKTLFKGHPNMDSLIAIGSGAAYVYGIAVIYILAYALGHGDTALAHSYGHELYFESAATIVVLIDFGKWLEARAKRRTSSALQSLMDLTPKEARVIRDGREVTLPIAEIVLGDQVILGPGENVAVDGVVLEGNTSIDESALSGESIPVEKSPGDKIMAATTNGGGRLIYRATEVGSDTTIAKIIALVEDANATKAPISKLADRVAGVFVPVVLVIASVTFIAWMLLGYGFPFALRLAIAVLVISCPCALGLATPVAIMVGTGKGAKAGVLFKSAESLEVLHHADTIFLDKTGTITRGEPFVTDVISLKGSPEELLDLAYILEKNSEHPLAEGVVRAFEDSGRGEPKEAATDFQALAGMGLSAKISGVEVFAGNEKLMRERKIPLEEHRALLEGLTGEGKTPLIFAREGELLGIIAAKDVVKSSSQAALERLKAMGKEIIMLTGDNEATARAIARDLPLSRVIASVLPQDKERYIREAQDQGKKTVMVGDGINDAPALVRADVGIAIGAGTDIAMESADVVLMKSDLYHVVDAFHLSKGTIRNIKQNLFWAFFYNVICIPVAMGIFYLPFGLTLNPMMAAFAMSFSSIFVVTNALRLNFLKLEEGREIYDVTETVEIHMEALGEGAHRGYQSEEMKKDLNKEEAMDKKVLTIEGMSCNHCVNRVETALNELEGVEAKVSLEPPVAEVQGESLSEEALKKAVEDAGYKVTHVA